MNITATYSPEDNKIRLYASERLDAETFDRVKEAGFKWAPKQELFVAPKWTPGREDLALELAGEIEPEEMTLAERAQAKAERLDELAAKRQADAGAFSRAARDISERFAQGQPILVGHHSERKARKDAKRAEAAQDKARKAHDLAGYWLYRAEGVERHANRKNDPRVRARRIKTLLAELRSLQRAINDANKALDLWEKATTPDAITGLLNHSDLAQAPYGLWSDVTNGKTDPQDARARCIQRCELIANGPNRRRWIQHTLNRLAYERAMLGPVPRFEGELTPTLLQMFVREHGADKPKGAKVDDDLFTIECAAPLPAHIGDGSSVELSGDEWRDLMQECGYEPPAKKPAKPPILNFKAGKIHLKSRATFRGADPVETLPQVEMTKAEYKAQRSGAWVQVSYCGQYRVRTCGDPNFSGPYYKCPRVAVFLTDSKEHSAPEGVEVAQ